MVIQCAENFMHGTYQSVMCLTGLQYCTLTDVQTQREPFTICKTSNVKNTAREH